MSDSDSDDEQPAKKKIEIGPGESQKRQARIVQEKALEEDPTIFQYDELYDDMTATREDAKMAKTTEVKKSKYIERLLVTAESRKKDYERRIERQVQRERAAEGDMYKDKETFVTATYRAKLEEMKKAEEAERREEYLEAIGDVTKQRGLDGFYRHLYEQKMGAPNAVPAAAVENTENVAEKSARAGSASKKKQRTYRRHDSSMDNDDDAKKLDAVPVAETDEPACKKVHLQSNIDADSDFSIDSDSDVDDEEKANSLAKSAKKEESSNQKFDGCKENPATAENAETNEPSAGANGKEKEHDFLKPNAPNGAAAATEPIKTEEKPFEIKEEAIAAPAKPKIDIWKKRTIGEVFDGALLRYYERKQFRCQQ